MGTLVGNTCFLFSGLCCFSLGNSRKPSANDAADVQIAELERRVGYTPFLYRPLVRAGAQLSGTSATRIALSVSANSSHQDYLRNRLQ